MRNLCLFIAMIGLLLVRQPAGGAEATVSAKIQAYQLYDLQQYEEAAAQFKRHVEQHPDDLPAALDYASLLSQLKRYKEAARVLEGLHQKNSEHEVVYFRLGVEYVNLQRSAEAERVFTELERSSNRELAKAATEAKRRLQEDGERVARFEAERKVFQLAGQFKHEEVVVAVNELEKQRPLPFALAMQRLYALQSLRHYAQALELANRLALDHQTATDLALLRAELLAQIGRRPDAVAIWRQIERENADTAAADQAARRLQSVAKQETGERVFELARQQRHREVVEAIDEFEQQGDLSLTMERQRIYAWQALGQGRRALDRANDLAATHPADAELALLRAALLVEQDQWEDAAEILRQVAREHPGTTAALEAEQRLGEESARRENGLAQEHLFEQRVFDLAARQQHREAAAAVDAQEKRGELSWSMQMQRLYALQALGETAGALELADRLALTHPEATDLALLRADLLIRTQRWQDAAAVLKEVKREHRDEPVAQEAERRLRSLPPVANLDRWYWGEAYLSGDYLGRFGTLVGAGFIRHGTFIPRARWLQPFQEFRFSLDTRSRIGGKRSVIADNFAAFSLGLRAQPFEAEYLYLYASVGWNKDLLGRREGGDWTEDFQAGVYGFKSWGPGTVLHTVAPEGLIPTTGSVPALSAQISAEEEPRAPNRFLWRRAWFADMGADFSYYQRYANCIGYGQAHQGYRLFQLGSRLGFDLYAVQNLSWDTRGNYFDNLVELGPGLRWLWAPRRGLEVVLRGEWLNGYYLGRDYRGARSGAESQYDDFRAGLSVGVRW